MKSLRETQIDELKRLIDILPDLETDSLMRELSYKRLVVAGYGDNRVGYAYLNWVNKKAEFEQVDNRRWQLIQELQLSCDMNGNPDFGESPIKPYGFDKDKFEDRFQEMGPVSRQY